VNRPFFGRALAVRGLDCFDTPPIALDPLFVNEPLLAGVHAVAEPFAGRGNLVMAIEAGLAWACVAEAMVVYVDHGVSPGMRNAIAFAENIGLPIEYRRLRPATELTAGWPSARGRGGGDSKEAPTASSGSYKAQGSVRGPPDATTSAYFGS
jgi:hypothetical protein